MSGRKEFKITEDQLSELLNASRPTPAMYLSGGTRMFETPQQNANWAWEKLGREIGFSPMTVRPIEGKDDHFFTAEIKAGGAEY